MDILQIQNLNYSIGHKSILKKVNLQFSLGKSYVLRGDNGAGKSTLLKLILNYSHHKDSIFWKHSIQNRNQLSYLGHDLGLYSSLSLEENLRFFSKLTSNGYSWKKIQEWVEMCNLNRRWEDPIHSFSRGMKQKAAIIRAILVKPLLLLLDEPFTGLDDKSYPILISMLQEIKKDSAILAVVHGMEDSFWENNLRLEKGEIL
ncbi:MAG: ATP-binding cassette domain-containing protein [Leptospira sp.]|nr:ATP-binding cassette domain-containing protein [Leptospira sp.]